MEVVVDGASSLSGMLATTMAHTLPIEKLEKGIQVANVLGQLACWSHMEWFVEAEDDVQHGVKPLIA